MDATDQAHDGRMWVFRSWPDGGGHNHVALTREEPATYTATFG